MAESTLLTELVKDGEQVLRSRPLDRAAQWKSWRNRVVRLTEEIPGLKTVGVQLTAESLATDLGILSRFARTLLDAPARKPVGTADTAQTSDVANTIVKIFISHKHEDEKTARGIKGAFERYGAGSVKVFLSEDIPKGANWIDWIHDRLAESHMLLLLFTDATRTWDWCLYEAGLFTELNDLKKRPVICIHSAATAAPGPLRHLQTVPAEEREVLLFLRQLFVDAKLQGIRIPLNPSLSEQPEELQRAAKEIVALVSRKPVKSDYFTKSLLLRIVNPGPGEIDPDSKIIADSSTLAVFGLSEGEWTWGKIVAQAREVKDQRWVRELTHAIQSATEGKLFEPVQASFQAQKGGKRYRPILYRADKLADGSCVFKILFSEDVSWQLVEVPKKLTSLTTALRMAVRFRFEVLIKYRGRIAAAKRRPGNENIIAELLQAISNIEMEARSSGEIDEHQLLSIFSTPEDRKEIEAMYEAWYEIRQALFDDGLINGSLDQKLDDMLQMNQKFISMGSRRFCELIEREPE